MVSKQGVPGRYHVMTLVLAMVLTFLMLLGSGVAADDEPQPRLPTIEVQINDKRLTVEIASTYRQQYMGLSFRKSLDENSGMLFVYPAEEQLTFTMRNTLIPLSIAFLSSDLVINEIHEMNVGPGQLFPSRQKAQFALEVNQGWFAANGIKAGDQIVRQ